MVGRAEKTYLELMPFSNAFGWVMIRKRPKISICAESVLLDKSSNMFLHKPLSVPSLGRYCKQLIPSPSVAMSFLDKVSLNKRFF